MIPGSIFVTRPDFWIPRTVQRLSEKGYEAISVPTSTVIFLPIPFQDGPFMVTSSLAVESLSRSSLSRNTRLYCVGERTAAYARAKGFVKTIFPQTEGVHALLKITPADVTYLRGNDVSVALNWEKEVMAYHLSPMPSFKLPWDKVTRRNGVGVLCTSPKSVLFFQKYLSLKEKQELWFLCRSPKIKIHVETLLGQDTIRHLVFDLREF